MMDAHGFLPDARLASIVLVAWLAVVLLHGLWRSMGEAKTDTIRPSGPTD